MSHHCPHVSSHITLILAITSITVDSVIGRRRKKSCIPRPATPGCCQECFARGVQCRDQEVSLGTKRPAQAGKHDLQQRVAELENALLSISQKLDPPSGITKPDDVTAKAVQQSSSGVSPPASTTSPDSDSETLLKHAPVLSLFDNAILSRQPDEARQDIGSVRSSGVEANTSTFKNDTLCRTLLSFFPPEQKQEALLKATYSWWWSWHDVYPHLFGLKRSCDVVRFVANLKSSGSVQQTAKALLCLLIIQQEVSHSLNTSYEITKAASDTSQALSIIDEKVLNDDELAGTIDGIECMILRTKYEMNASRIRKAWLLYRRAISLAQVSGLHKRTTNAVNDTSLSSRKDSLWKALYIGDRFLSLMLGLPYGSTEIHSDIGRDSEAWAKGIQTQNIGEHYFYRLAHIIGHIIDRNQQLPSNNMLPLTFKIDGEMMELAASMPNDWWESGRESGAEADRMFNQLLPQFSHYQARSLLHLPFMLKATTDRRFEYNKIAALESAREMIARYRVIRPAQGFGSLICKTFDFQVFGGAMILVLNLLDHYRNGGTLDHSEADKDQALISVTADILRRASVETDGGVATQAARALEIFGNIKELFYPCTSSEADCTTKVVVPYFGTVVIGAGTSLKCQAPMQEPKSTLQPHQLPTPSEQSLDGSTPESVPTGNSIIESTMPFDFNYGENSEDANVNGDLFADVNFDLDQDWTWFWNNTEVPSADLQGTLASVRALS